MKTLTDIDLHEITGGEIDPLTMGLGWDPARAAAELAIGDFLTWWAHYTQSLGLNNGQQAD